MADPICRWRNPYVKTVREFISELPKKEMSSVDFRSKMDNSGYGADFFRTPYQLACQLGLYQELDGNYFPRFKHNAGILEVNTYLKSWLNKYPVPNPYTKQGFVDVPPVGMHSEMCKLLFEKKDSINWDEVKMSIFKGEIGNDDILINTINLYSDVLLVKSGKLQLKEGVFYDDLPQFILTNTFHDRNNKKSFFDLFGGEKPIVDKQDNSFKNIVIEASSIREFALLVFKYFYSDDWNAFLKQTNKSKSKINDVEFESHDFDNFKRIIGEFDAPQAKNSLTSGGTPRYFEEAVFNDGKKNFYFSTQWNVPGDYSLSYENMKNYFETNFAGYQFEKDGNKFKLFQTKRSTLKSFDISFFKKDLEQSGIKINSDIITRFICSILSKQFLILTGLSGSGKTKLAQAFSKWMSEDKSQICIVPVGADWTNREQLLGFPSALEEGKYIFPENGALKLIIEANKPENSDKPFFLILDEMNLSHVERYFSDFLSLMESKELINLHNFENESEVPQNVFLPQNIYIIGTVNIDETTYMFSPKVLDRSNVIEFRIDKSEMKEYLTNLKSVDLGSLASKGVNMAYDFVTISGDTAIVPKKSEELNSELILFFEELKKAGAEFGYRSASEISRFVGVVNKLSPDWTVEKTIDSAIMQKLLPKLHGSRRKLDKTLKVLGSLCLTDKITIDDCFKEDAHIPYSDSSKVKYPVSLEKIIRMYHKMAENGFVSYAEA